MEHFKNGQRPTKYGPAEYFTGTVLQDLIVEAPAPARIRAVRVTFLPCARTNWHTHPFGQTLHVLSGVGLVCKWNERPQQILPGDTVWIAPGEKHWHGACAEKAMTHIAMQEQKDGVATDWLEPVTDAQYSGT